MVEFEREMRSIGFENAVKSNYTDRILLGKGNDWGDVKVDTILLGSGRSWGDFGVNTEEKIKSSVKRLLKRDVRKVTKYLGDDYVTVHLRSLEDEI